MKLIAISGVKNSGKTTLIEKLIPLLRDKGLVTATIKHDGHSFTPDTPGTDSFRFFQAGACGSAIFDGEKFSVSRRCSVTERELAQMFPEADVILLEGFKDSRYPKIEIIRSEINTDRICADETVLAYVSDAEIKTTKPVFPLDEADIVADYIATVIYR